MQVLVALTVGLMFWITAWAFGIKSFDAFMVTIVMLVVAATVHIVVPFLPGNRRAR